MSDLKPALTHMIYNYEKSGQGSLNQNIESPEWRDFNIKEYNGNGDWSRFIIFHTKTILLYM